MFKVTFYRTASGECPMLDFINGLDLIAKRQIAKQISILEREGIKLRYPDSRPLGDQLFELRVRERSNAYRMIYFFIEGSEIIMTNGFTKKTQKTPEGEIERAKQYRKDFYERRDK